MHAQKKLGKKIVVVNRQFVNQPGAASVDYAVMIHHRIGSGAPFWQALATDTTGRPVPTVFPRRLRYIVGDT